MTERKFTKNLKSRGMAQQLRESVSKVIHQDQINVSFKGVENSSSIKTSIDNFSSHMSGVVKITYFHLFTTLFSTWKIKETRKYLFQWWTLKRNKVIFRVKHRRKELKDEKKNEMKKPIDFCVFYSEYKRISFIQVNSYKNIIIIICFLSHVAVCSVEVFNKFNLLFTFFCILSNRAIARGIFFSSQLNDDERMIYQRDCILRRVKLMMMLKCVLMRMTRKHLQKYQ